MHSGPLGLAGFPDKDQAESLTIEDLKVGAGLLCDVKGKMYPVEVLEFEGQYIYAEY